MVFPLGRAAPDVVDGGLVGRLSCGNGELPQVWRCRNSGKPWPTGAYRLANVEAPSASHLTFGSADRCRPSEPSACSSGAGGRLGRTPWTSPASGWCSSAIPRLAESATWRENEPRLIPKASPRSWGENEPEWGVTEPIPESLRGDNEPTLLERISTISD